MSIHWRNIFFFFRQPISEEGGATKNPEREGKIRIPLPQRIGRVRKRKVEDEIESWGQDASTTRMTSERSYWGVEASLIRECGHVYRRKQIHYDDPTFISRTPDPPSFLWVTTSFIRYPRTRPLRTFSTVKNTVLGELTIRGSGSDEDT